MFKKYYPLINREIRKYKVPSYLHEDTTQELLEVIYNAINTFDDTKEALFYTYIMVLMDRRIIRLLYHNEEYRMESILEDSNIPAREDVYSNYIYEATLKEIYNQLDDTDKLIFIDAFIAKKPVADISKETKKSCKSVYNRIYRIRKRIKDIL